MSCAKTTSQKYFLNLGVYCTKHNLHCKTLAFSLCKFVSIECILRYVNESIQLHIILLEKYFHYFRRIEKPKNIKLTNFRHGDGNLDAVSQLTPNTTEIFGRYIIHSKCPEFSVTEYFTHSNFIGF
jgi:hypothetical protein